ncbi:MAG: hypothetical protein ACXWDL_10490, partial [Nocardioides sp.]
TTFSDQALLASDLLLADYAENGDDASIEELREFTSTSMDTLTQVESLLPDEARDELVHAAEVLGDIDAAAGGACPECSGGIAEIPPVLQSAGQLAERPVVVVPAPLLKEGRPATGGGPQQGGAQGPRQDDAQADAQDEGQDEGQDDGQDDGDPATDPPIAPDTGAAPGTGTGTGAGPTSPLEVLTDVTTGQGGGQNPNGGGLPGVPGGGEVIDDVEDSLPDLP